MSQKVYITQDHMNENTAWMSAAKKYGGLKLKLLDVVIHDRGLDRYFEYEFEVLA